MLTAGDKAPTFKLPSDQGKAIALNDFAGSYVVVYFYPKDDTPGCTRQAQAFSEMQRAFAGLGTTVLGISRDGVDRHEKFRKKYDLRIPLLSDGDLTVHKLYGTYGTKMMYGRETQGTIRTTYIVGPTGRVAAVFPKVRVDGHAEKVLDALRDLQGGAGGDADANGRENAITKRDAKAPAPAKAAKKPASAKKTATAKKTAVKKASATPTKKKVPSRTRKA